jgi:hypothetical protein
VLNGTPERRDRAGFGQPRAATLREEPRAGRTPNIAREKNDPLAQGRILTCQEGVEGWPVQGGPMQVTHNHVIVPLLELGQGVLAIARRAGAEIVKLATQLKSPQWFSTPLRTCSPSSALPQSPLTYSAASSKCSAQLASGCIVRLLDGLTLSRSTPRDTPFRGSPVWSMQMPKRLHQHARKTG